MKENRDNIKVLKGNKPNKFPESPNMSLEEIEKDRQIFKDFLLNIQEKDTSFQDKMDEVLKMNATIVPYIFQELTSDFPDLDRAAVASKAMSSIKEICNVIIKKRDMEISDDINPNSAKFQAVFGWFMELIHDVISRQGLDTIQINNIFSEISIELSGWEEIILKKLKGLSAKALAEVKNPLLKTEGK